MGNLCASQVEPTKAATDKDQSSSDSPEASGRRSSGGGLISRGLSFRSSSATTRRRSSFLPDSLSKFIYGNKAQKDELGDVDVLTAQNIKEFNADFHVEGWDSDEEEDEKKKKEVKKSSSLDNSSVASIKEEANENSEKE